LTYGEEPVSNEETREKHPSYGMAGFYRVSGNPGRLFGSSLERHESYICLRIGTGERVHSNGWDRYHGSLRGEHIEVMFSAAQFAELLTSMNVGNGVPCTIQYLAGKKVEPPPEDIEIEVDKVRNGFKKDMEKIASKFRPKVAEVEAILEKKSLSKSDREQVMRTLFSVVDELTGHAPFILQMFEEAAEKVVQHSKAEIDAFVTSNVIDAGIKAMAASMVEPPSEPALPAPKEDK
jgi:hypothetical protein